MYPIKSAQPTRVLAKLLNELISAEVGKAVTAATWDKIAQQWIKKRETQQNNAIIHRIAE